MYSLRYEVRGIRQDGTLDTVRGADTEHAGMALLDSMAERSPRLRWVLVQCMTQHRCLAERAPRE